MFPPHWFRPHHLPPSPTISSSFFRPLCAYPLQLTNIANHSSPTPRHPPSSLATSYYAVDASDVASCCSIFYNDDAIRFHFDVDRIKQKEVNEKKIQTKREKKTYGGKSAEEKGSAVSDAYRKYREQKVDKWACGMLSLPYILPIAWFIGSTGTTYILCTHMYNITKLAWMCAVPAVSAAYNIWLPNCIMAVCLTYKEVQMAYRIVQMALSSHEGTRHAQPAAAC